MDTIKVPKFKNKLVFITGSPWAGKSTQCLMIVKKFPEFDAFNCGGALRNAVASETEIGKRVRD
jgi:adenylate kinase family enzyme